MNLFAHKFNPSNVKFRWKDWLNISNVSFVKLLLDRSIDLKWLLSPIALATAFAPINRIEHQLASKWSNVSFSTKNNDCKRILKSFHNHLLYLTIQQHKFRPVHLKDCDWYSTVLNWHCSTNIHTLLIDLKNSHFNVQTSTFDRKLFISNGEHLLPEPSKSIWSWIF